MDEQDAKDAARYRWLTTNRVRCYQSVFGDKFAHFEINMVGKGNDIDAVIDQAIAAEESAP